MTRLGVEAEFIGSQSLGFIPKSRYALFFTLQAGTTAPILITTQDGRRSCYYASMRAFLDNWLIIH